jgi:hypothetical protein
MLRWQQGHCHSWSVTPAPHCSWAHLAAPCATHHPVPLTGRGATTHAHLQALQLALPPAVSEQGHDHKIVGQVDLQPKHRRGDSQPCLAARGTQPVARCRSPSALAHTVIEQEHLQALLQGRHPTPLPSQRLPPPPPRVRGRSRACPRPALSPAGCLDSSGNTRSYWGPSTAACRAAWRPAGPPAKHRLPSAPTRGHHTLA